MSPSQVSSGPVYAEVGPHVPPAAVMPPANDSHVQYTAVVHDQNMAKDSEGMTSLSQHEFYLFEPALTFMNFCSCVESSIIRHHKLYGCTAIKLQCGIYPQT